MTYWVLNVGNTIFHANDTLRILFLFSSIEGSYANCDLHTSHFE